MGGCRCCFRQCPVASERNKGMHFFKFPIKQKERFQQWIKLAGVEQLIDLGNKVICARHFPDTHFMNYKRNRLTMSALPSIHRLNEEYALDYSNDVNNPSLNKLPPITRPHLIPPTDFPCTMVFIAADRKIAEDIIRSYEENAESPMESIINESKPSSSRLMQEVKKPKLDEVNLTEDDYVVYYDLEKNGIKKKHFVLKDKTCELIEISDIETNDPTLNEELSEMNDPMKTDSVQYFDQKVLDRCVEKLTSTKSTQCSLDENCDKFFENVQDELTKEIENLEKTKQMLNDSDEKIARLSSKLNAVSDENEKLKAQLLNCEKLNVELNKELLDLKSENGALEQHNKNLESQYMAMCKQKQQEQVTSSISKHQKSPTTNQNHQLTKVQLFSGIKKYLSQTMIAFLRIQLSSSSEERDWKPDEKRLAVDLMGLGEDVYKYFTDEWVIRLPPIRQVRQWQSELNVVDEEEDI